MSIIRIPTKYIHGRIKRGSVSGVGGGGQSESSLLNGLISHWKLNEASGETAIDSHGANHLNLVVNAGSGPGKIGTARTFTSAGNSSLGIADNDDVSVGNEDFTLALWANLDTVADFQALVSKYDGTVGGSEFILAYSNVDNVFRFVVFDGTGNAGPINAVTFGTPLTGVWIFAVAWYDSVADTVNIQINNGAVDSAAYTQGSNNGPNPFTIGLRGGLPLTASADSLWYWRRKVTADELTTLYNSGNGLDYPG